MILLCNIMVAEISELCCLKFLSVNFNDTQVCKGETSKKTTIHNLNHGPDMGFYGPLVNQSE